MNRALADTSVFIAAESGRPVGDLPDELAVSVISLAELEVGVLTAADAVSRGRRLATLERVRTELPIVPVSERIAATFASLVAEMRELGRRHKVHDTWIAATALVMGVPVCTQDDDFDVIPRVEIIKV